MVRTRAIGVGTCSLVVASASGVGAWEWRRARLMDEWRENKRKFEETMTGVPFYGRRTGAAVDYGIEMGLASGDWFDVVHDRRYLSAYEALKRELRRWTSVGSAGAVEPDEVVIVLRMRGQAFVLRGDHEIRLMPYAEWLGSPEIKEVWLSKAKQFSGLEDEIRKLAENGDRNARLGRNHTWIPHLEAAGKVCVRQ